MQSESAQGSANSENSETTSGSETELDSSSDEANEAPAPVTQVPTHDPAGASPIRQGLGSESRIAFFAIVIFILGALFWPSEEDTTAPMGNLVDGTGSIVPLASQVAPVTLVHFWSTWCPPCIVETPAIQRLAQDYEDNRRFSLVMVAVSDDETKVRDFLGPEKMGLLDPDWKVAKSYGTDKLPETHLVVDGHLVESFIGAVDWDDPKIRKKIDDALGSASSGRI